MAIVRLLVERRTIGQATGVLMYAHNCSLEEAQRFLTDESARQGVDVVTLAGILVEAQLG